MLACGPSTQETEARRSRFKASQPYIGRPCLKTTNKINKKEWRRIGNCGFLVT
jgi:hypothetical protein